EIHLLIRPEIPFSIFIFFGRCSFPWEPTTPWIANWMFPVKKSQLKYSQAGLSPSSCRSVSSIGSLESIKLGIYGGVGSRFITSLTSTLLRNRREFFCWAIREY